jgi:hypothetical protein
MKHVPYTAGCSWRAKVESMGTRRCRRGLRLCKRCALPRRGDMPRHRQILCATKCEKLSDVVYMGEMRAEHYLFITTSSRASGSRRTFHRPPGRRHHHTPPRVCRWQTRMTRAAVRWTRSCTSPSVRSRKSLAREVPGASRVHGTIAERLSRLPTRVAPEATSVGNTGSWNLHPPLLLTQTRMVSIGSE